jgi:DNA-binding LytR/AlgR family response regulator
VKPSLRPELRHDTRIVGRSSGNRLVFVVPAEVWAFEAQARLVFVHGTQGRFDVDMSLTELESPLGSPFLRVHRNWLVGLAKVRELRWKEGFMHLFVGEGVPGTSADTRGVEVPVAGDRVREVRRHLLAGTIGVVSRRARGGVATLTLARPA